MTCSLASRPITHIALSIPYYTLSVNLELLTKTDWCLAVEDFMIAAAGRHF